MQVLKEKLENKKIQTILIILSFPLLVQVMYYVYKMGMIYGTIIRKLYVVSSLWKPPLFGGVFIWTFI